MGTTPTYALRYPEGADPPQGAAQMKALADDVDTTMAGQRARVRRTIPTASGTLAPGSELEYASMTLPDPFPGHDYILRAGCMAKASVPAQAGFVLRLYAGPTLFGSMTVTNAGTTGATYTLSSASDALLMSGPIVVRATIQALVGTVVVSADNESRFLFATAVPGQTW